MSVSISYKGFEMRGFIKKCKRFSKCPPPSKKKKKQILSHPTTLLLKEVGILDIFIIVDEFPILIIAYHR